jgi:hypothetical protein
MWFNVYRIILLFLPLCTLTVEAQELFPLNEPASSIPKGVFGLRAFTQNYPENNLTRSLYAFRVMYGATSKLSVMATGSVSNHHDRKLPPDLINHSHSGSQTTYFTQAITRGVRYPYLFNGIHVFGKYRFLTVDKQNQHFRMSAYGEWSNVGVAHDEAEPNLMDDTGGYGFGLITTWLKNRFAVSLTSGYVRPDSYFEMQPDQSGGPDLPTRIHYGDAIRYNLSLGYRLYPNHYTDYDQVNWNVYVEFLGKTYDDARVIQNGTEIETKTVALRSNSYVEIHPGIQRIVKSNTRIEFSVGLSLLGNSYAHFTPMWTLAVQRYFYRNSKTK